MVMENNEADFDLEKSYNESFKNLEENTIVSASVIDVSSDTVFLDLGCKSEAKVLISEFDETPKIGDVIDIYLVKLEGRNGDPVVSKKRCDMIKEMEELKSSLANNEIVTGKVVEVKKNGFKVKYKSISGFIPFSIFDVKKVDNPAQYKNQEIKFYIEKINDNRYGRKNDSLEDFMANRKKLLREENKIEKEKFFEEKKEGDILEGEIRNFTDYGAFVNVGPLEALLHIKDVSWIKIDKIDDVLKIGDKIKVKILNLNSETKKVAVGLKQTEEEPWDKFLDKFNEGDVVKGTVSSIVPFGAFIKIIEGVEGLLHISDMSWTKNIRNPSEMLQKGQQAEVKIIGIDKEERRISLSLKHLLDNPWDNVGEKYSEGTKVKGKIKTITSFGVFIELEEGIDALLHKDDIDWVDRIEDPFEYFKGKEETEIDAVIIQLDQKNNKIKVGIKQLSNDPWQVIKDNVKKNSVLECELTAIDEEKGLQVKIHDYIAYIPYNQVDFGKPEDIKATISDRFKVGEKIKVWVQNVDYKRRMINLSIKDFEKMEEKKKIQEYLHDNKEDATFTLEDMLKSKNDD